METILNDECGLVKNRLIIVGVSGGADSLCLMETLRQAGYPILVAHFNHQLRPEAEQDALLVEKIASRLMLDCVIYGADVRSHADQEKLSIEEAARNLRYRFMFKLARERNAQAVAVGHTADDQVETVLMHFLRGSALTGLKGMSFRSVIKSFDPQIPIVRPLLKMRREETVEYCAVNGLYPQYDSSNDSLDFQRNRIRHLLIPKLESYNPKFRQAVLRMADSLKGDYDFVMETLEKAWRETVIAMDEKIITFNADLLSKYSVGLQRNLVKQAMQILRPGVDISFSILERATNRINGNSQSMRVDLKGGLHMFRELGLVHICTLDAELPFNLWPQIIDVNAVLVSVPGQVDLAGGWRLNCERSPIPALAKEQAERNEDQFQVWLDVENLSESFELRTRREGDHFLPFGMDGHSQKLSDFFVNEKVPQRAREHWPLLCVGGEILWVPGYRSAHPYRLKSTTRNVIYFSVTRPPDKIIE